MLKQEVLAVVYSVLLLAFIGAAIFFTGLRAGTIIASLPWLISAIYGVLKGRIVTFGIGQYGRIYWNVNIRGDDGFLVVILELSDKSKFLMPSFRCNNATPHNTVKIPPIIITRLKGEIAPQITKMPNIRISHEKIFIFNEQFFTNYLLDFLC